MTKNVQSASAFSSDSLQMMLMYAWRLWPSAGLPRGSSKRVGAPLDLLANLLAEAIIKAEKSGLQRKYLPETEITHAPRGRIQFQQTVLLRAQRDTRLAVETDEFSTDCLANQALAAAARGLLACDLSKDVREILSVAEAKLSFIPETKVTSRNILNELREARRLEYRMGLSIAHMLIHGQVFSPAETGIVSFREPVTDDEHLFRNVYESFLREFFRFHRRDAFVGGRHYQWSSEPRSLVPLMRTDINIEAESSVLVIDAKCTPRSILRRGDFATQSLNSGHLYQLFTYMFHAKNLNPDKSIRGALVYPQYEHEVDEVIGTEVGSIRVKTVNFRQDWGVVSQELLELAA